MSGDVKTHRGTIFAEPALVRAVEHHPCEQYVVRFDAPRCARHAQPGSFVHLKCDDAIPMRRPLSIMRANPTEGWIDVLFKTVGPGLAALARKRPGERLHSLGPIGRGFQVSPERPHTVLIGGGVGIPPMLFLAETLAGNSRWQPIVFMGSEIPFPFELVESSLDRGWRGHSLALLEELGIAGRLASLAELAGTYRGYVTDLAAEYLDGLSAEALGRTELFACGPTPMLAAAAAVAHRFGLPCQVSLEEYMACAVGGCAGCTVRVETATGPAMQRVCVDGPVFDAMRVFPPAATG